MIRTFNSQLFEWIDESQGGENDQDFDGRAAPGSIRCGKWMECVLKLIHS